MIQFLDAYALCKEMGWDWWTLQSQPLPFVETIRDVIRSRNKKKK